jgi:ABC-2 type transport system ATP-binding protein
MSSPVVHLEHLTKQYANSNQPAVDDLSLEIPEGSVFGLLGPNGAGKSTTVMILCGLMRPDYGTVTVMQQRMPDQGATVRKKIGVAPQEIALFPGLTAYENLSYFGRMYGLPTVFIQEQIEHYLKTFGLLDKAKKPVSTYSGGMKKRLNLIAALLHQPRLIILDEPTAGVDVQSRHMILDFLKTLNTRGTTILYSSHMLEEAERICSHIGIIDEGRLITSGTLAGVMEQHPDCANLEKLFLELTGKNIRD